MSASKQEADKLRSEASKLLCSMFKIPEGYSSGTVERIVDCIVGAAVLEVGALMFKGTQPVTPPPGGKESL